MLFYNFKKIKVNMLRRVMAVIYLPIKHYKKEKKISKGRKQLKKM